MSERTAQLLGVVALAAADRMRAAIEDELGIAGGAGAALVHVEAHPGGSVNDLAGVLGITQPAAVRLVDRLVGQGLLIRRDGPDKRTRSLVAPPAGVAAAETLRDRRQGALETLLEGLTDAEVAAVEPVLSKIAAGLADDRPGALRACRLCDRLRCEAHGEDVCPLEHTTTPERGEPDGDG